MSFFSIRIEILNLLSANNQDAPTELFENRKVCRITDRKLLRSLRQSDKFLDYKHIIFAKQGYIVKAEIIFINEMILWEIKLRRSVLLFVFTNLFGAKCYEFNQKKPHILDMRLIVIPAGFEPATHSLEGCCSIRLSYETVFSDCKINKIY